MNEPTGDGLRILIVEDESDLSWAMVLALGRDGHQLLSAGNGQEGLALAREGVFDLAFVDAKLPDLAGEEVARRLMTLQPGLPVVLISGYLEPEDPVVMEGVRRGLYQGFLSKPFDLGKLRRMVRGATRVA